MMKTADKKIEETLNDFNLILRRLFIRFSVKTYQHLSTQMIITKSLKKLIV